MTDSTKIRIQPCAANDIPEFFSVMSRSFGHDAPFVDIYFPKHDTEEGSAQGSKRLSAWFGSGTSYFLKAVIDLENTEQDKIIGIAVWTHMKEAPSADIAQLEDVESVWPVKSDAEYMKHLWSKYVVPRTNAIETSNGAGVYVLELLAVDTTYQGRGAGTALMRWGTDKADQDGLAAVVEATVVGRRAYEKAGFRARIEQMDFDTDEKFPERTKPVLIFMKREEQ